MKLTRALLALLFISISMPRGYPQARPAPPRPQKPAPASSRPAYMQYMKAYEENPFVTKVVLRNGLTVLINEFKGAPLAAISTCAKCGYANEPEEIAGVSGVLEKIIFGRTPTRGAGVMSKELRSLGGTWESKADLEHTTHGIVVQAAQWKKALQLEADATLNPLFEPDELAHAIAAAARDGQSWLVAGDRPGGRMMQPREILRGAAGRDRDKAASALKGITRERLMEHHKACYSPSRLILVVSGDVTSSEILTEVVNLYGKLPAAPEKPAPAPREALTRSLRYAEVRGDVAKPQVIFGFQTVPAGSSDYPALEVLKAILGKGESAVVSRRLRDQKKVVLGGRVDHFARTDAGYLALELEVEPQDLDRAEISALTEIEVIKHQEPDDGDLERAWALLEREYWDRLQTVSGRVHAIADFELLGDWKKMNGHIGRLRQVKAEDITRVAAKYLRLENCSLAEYLPAAQEPRNLTSEKVTALFRQLLQPALEQELAERERETVPAVDIPKESAPFKPSEVRGSFRTSSILRGPDLFIREDHTLPLIHLGFFFPGGRILERPQNQGITALMLNCMLQGTREKTAAQRHRQLEIYGGRMLPVVSSDYFGVQFAVLSRNVERSLDLLAEIITAPKFDEEDVTRQKRSILDSIRSERELDENRGRQLLEAALFKGHPYGLGLGGIEGSLSSLTAASVKEWYKATVEHKKPIVVIVGDTQGTSLAGFFVRSFSGSRFQEVRLPDAFPSPTAEKGKQDESGTGDRSTVLMGFQAPALGDEDYFPVAVLSSYLDGAGSRLSDQMQATCGLDCDLSVRYEARVRGGLATACVQAPGGGEDKAFKLLESELRRIPEEPIPYRDYRAAVNQAVGRFLIDQQDRFLQIRAVVENILSARGIDALQEDATRLQEVKQEEMVDMAQRILKLEKSFVVWLRAKAASQ